MCRMTLCAAVFSCLFGYCSPIVADELAESSKMVSLELVIAEFQAGQSREAGWFEVVENPVERLGQLEREGRIGAVARIQLMTLEHYATTAQIGESRPVVTGRSRSAMAFREDRPGAGTTTASYSTRNFGTRVTATPWVEKDGSARVQLEVERSRLVPAGAEKDGTTDEMLSRTVTVSGKCLVRVPVGRTILIAGVRSVDQGDTGELLVLLSARVVATPAATERATAGPGRQLRVFKLRYLAAKSAAESVSKLINDESMRTAVDERANSLIVFGSVEALDAIASLLTKLDEKP